MNKERSPSSKINNILKKAIDKNASDIHIKVGSPPIVRIYGKLLKLSDERIISKEDAGQIAISILKPKLKEAFNRNNDIDFSYSVPGLGRFRVNLFVQRGTVGIVFRVVPWEIPKIEDLNLPVVLKKIALEMRGLVLVTGTTGSGKSTSLAAMIDYINSHRTYNIITIEDPIEYLHRDKNSIVSQREIGSDTESFSKSIRAALRQDPDVILVGEMRDFETIQTAITAAETGHLVFSTLHTVDATETINRIISVFPPYQNKQIRLQLASILKGVVSMRLLPNAAGTGRVPAVEVLLNTDIVKDYIIIPEKTNLIHDVIAKGKVIYSMQTFDQSLIDLYSKDLITYEEALMAASKPDDFALKVKGIQSTADLAEEDEQKQDTQMEIERFGKGQ